MSLLDQSYQVFPTSVQVTVHQARNLRVKGKHGTNDAFAIIQLAKDKFCTAVAEKSASPVWKEEASFDLPLFHPENAERCTLYIIVMHRGQVGLDKFLGQAVLNLLDLYDNKSRQKTEWFKLVNKDKKEDKVRGEVLLDIQFMRNNMSASMFDLSMKDKPRSRMSKLKDKVRGKKKDNFSDSVSAIVPSVSQVLTDSEGEADSQSLNQAPQGKKKSKLKNLFAPKSNLQRNISQSMFTLGTLPEKNSSLSSSRSSGLNVDSPEGKKKLKLLGHKRTGSSDSKVSLGAFSLLGRSKQGNNDLNNLCINGSHVYTEEAETKSGSTLSLNSAGQGSAEDVHKHTPDAFTDISKSVPVPSYTPESTDKALMEQQRHQEEENRRLAEEKRIADAKRLEEEERYKAEAKRLQEEEQQRQQEEQERRKRFIEDEARRKKQKEEEERRKKEEGLRMLEEAENQRREEERRKAEEQKRQEEASMSDRLTSLFGMIRKKEEKKDEEQLVPPAPHTEAKSLVQPVSRRSINPFEDIPLSSDPPPANNQSPSDHLKPSHNPQTPSATVFLNRTAKVSAVKPRLAQILESEPADCQTPSQSCPSPDQSESTHSSVSSESFDTFSSLHSSLAPPNTSRELLGSPCGSTENFSSVESGRSSPTMADQKKRVLLPPSYPVKGSKSKGNQGHVREIQNPAYEEADGSQQKKKNSVPLPDYETLFPQRRHGVQGQILWDHIVAEVNQKHTDNLPELMGPEMSVDGPEEPKPSPRSSISQENPAVRKNQETKHVSSKKVSPPPPPKSSASLVPRTVGDPSQGHSQTVSSHSETRSSPSPVPSSVKTETSGGGIPRDVLVKKTPLPSHTSPAPRSPSRQAADETPSDDQRKEQVSLSKGAPIAKPRQRASGSQPTNKEESVATTDSSNTASMDKKGNLAPLDLIASTDLLSNDSPLNHNQEMDIFESKVQPEQKSEPWGQIPDDSDNIFKQGKPADPFVGRNASDSVKQSDHRVNQEESNQLSPAFQRRNSHRGKKIHPAAGLHSERKNLMSQEEPGLKEGTASTVSSQAFSTKDVLSTSATLQHQTDEKMEDNNFEGDGLTRAGLFYKPSLAPSGPLPVVLEEQASQTENSSPGKSLLKAWVSPSEVQPVTVQNSSGGGLTLNLRRPHPVKPLSPADSSPAVKEIKVWDTTPGKMRVADSGPYSQLTQEELVTLVVKQQTDLSRKDAKIVELEEYIDNLLVRVIEEKPSILHSLNAAKPV